MATELAGKLLKLEISSDGGTTYKTGVCAISFDETTQVPFNPEETDCGRIGSPGEAFSEISAEFITELAPSGTQFSYKDVKGWCVNGTKVKVRIQNPVVGAVTLGSQIYHEAEYYVTSIGNQKNTSQSVRFNVSMSSVGVLDITV
jgi:hypothetical protein